MIDKNEWYKNQTDFHESDSTSFIMTPLGKDSLHVNQEFGIFLDFLRIPKKAKVLEVGCGDGNFTKYLLQAGYDVTAIDLTDDIITKARELMTGTGLEGQLRLQTANLEQLPFGNNTFDACVCVHVLHHVQDIKKALEEMSRVVEESGIVGFIEPNPYCPYWYIYIPFCRKRKWEVERGLKRCSGKNLIKWMSQSGLDKIEKKGFGFIPSWVMRDNKILAKLEKVLSRMPLINLLAGATFFKGIKK